MRPVPKRHRHVRHRVLLYFAYLGKKFNLKILWTLMGLLAGLQK